MEQMRLTNSVKRSNRLPKLQIQVVKSAISLGAHISVQRLVISVIRPLSARKLLVKSIASKNGVPIKNIGRFRRCDEKQGKPICEPAEIVEVGGLRGDKLTYRRGCRSSMGS